MDARQSKIYGELKLKVEEMGWKLLSDKYKNRNIQLLFACPEGHENYKLPFRVKHKLICMECFRVSSNTIRQEYFSLLINENYLPITEYKDHHTYVTLLCPQGHPLIVKPNDFHRRNHRCTVCFKGRYGCVRDNFLRLLHEEGYINLSANVKMTKMIDVICPKGHFTTIRPDNFVKKKAKCKVCDEKKKKRDHVKSEKFLAALASEGYKTIDTYTHNLVLMNVICPKNHDWKVSPNHFHVGVRCLYCWRESRRERVLALFDELFVEGYILCTEYINITTDVTLRCPNSHIWPVTPSNLLYGKQRCPNCPRSMSRGERIAKDILDKYGISYIMQKKFDFLPTRRYDFYFIYNGQPYILEVDGLQHMTYVELYHDNIEGFYRKQQIDIEKTYHPIANGINVIRISATEMDFTEYHIKCALELRRNLYVSNKYLYKYITKSSWRPNNNLGSSVSRQSSAFILPLPTISNYATSSLNVPESVVSTKPGFILPLPSISMSAPHISAPAPSELATFHDPNLFRLVVPTRPAFVLPKSTEPDRCELVLDKLVIKVNNLTLGCPSPVLNHLDS